MGTEFQPAVTGSDSRLGRARSTPGFEEETRAYMQQRLRLLSGTLALITALLLVAFTIANYRRSGAPLASVVVDMATGFPNSILFAMVAAVTVIWLVLRSRRLGSGPLTALDGIFLQVLIVPCLLLFGRLHWFSFAGFPVVVPFIMLFILARAVLVPSTALRTSLLGLPAALAVLAIQLYYGESLAFPDQPYPASHFVDTVIQNQVLLWGAIGVAATASRVNLGLRRRSYDARRLGQYRIEGRIGAGSMGEVFLATHALLRRPTAVKLLRPEIAGDSTLRRFEREVRQTSRLTHPNTISIFDYGHTADGVFYYAMEYLRGANLRDVVERTGPMPPERAIHVLSHACGALAEAHGLGIIHRDIKPENVMLCEQGGEHDVVKLLDFGLVKDIADAGAALAESGTVVGTPQTLAPETLSGGDVDGRADLYSLSVVGYYLLTGRPIFDASGAAEFIRMHQSAQPVPPSVRLPAVPADLERLILRGLRKDPGERFPSAAALREALLECEGAGRWSVADAASWWARHADDLSLGEVGDAALPAPPAAPDVGSSSASSWKTRA